MGMIRTVTTVKPVPDAEDQDVAQVLHRVGVTKITIERNDGTTLTYEPIIDPLEGKEWA